MSRIHSGMQLGLSPRNNIMQNGLATNEEVMEINEARFVVSENDRIQLQVDINTFIKDDKRRNVLANLVLNDVAKLEYTVAKAMNSEIEDLYAQFNPEEKKQIIEC